jgi:hypothetical protein
MRDQIDSDITFYLYAVIEFIEQVLKESNNKARILVHCYKVGMRFVTLYRETQGLQLL